MVQFYLYRRLYVFGYICIALLQTCFADVIGSGLGNFLGHIEETSFNTTRYPSASPSMNPSLSPTPTMIPTVVPSPSPTNLPSSTPSVRPTSRPTKSLPTVKPSVSPTLMPSISPSIAPSLVPTIAPSAIPTQTPSVLPSSSPTVSPSVSPTSKPSKSPSFMPSSSPSITPSSVPTTAPSVVPTEKPSVLPSSPPTVMPTFSVQFPLILNQLDKIMSDEDKMMFEETIKVIASQCVDDRAVGIVSSHVISQELDGSKLKLELRVDGMCLHSVKDTVQQSIVDCFHSNHNELASQYEQLVSQKASKGTRGWVAVVFSLLFAAVVGTALFLYRRRKKHEDEEIYEFSPHHKKDLDIPRLDTDNAQVVMGCSGDEEVVMNVNHKVATEQCDRVDNSDSSDGYSSFQTEQSSVFPGGFHVTKSAAEAASNLPDNLITNSLMDADSTVASSKKSEKSVSTVDVEKGVCCFAPFNNKRAVETKEKFVDNPSGSEEDVQELRKLSAHDRFTSNNQGVAKIDVNPSLHRIFKSAAQKNALDLALPSHFYDGRTTVSKPSPAGLLITEDGENLIGLTNLCLPPDDISTQMPVIDQASSPPATTRGGHPDRFGRNDQTTVHNRNAGDTERMYEPYHEDEGEPNKGHEHDVEEGEGEREGESPLPRNTTISDNTNTESNIDNDEEDVHPFEHEHPSRGRGRMASVLTGHEGELVPYHDIIEDVPKNQSPSSPPRRRSEPIPPPSYEPSPPPTPRASQWNEHVQL